MYALPPSFPPLDVSRLGVYCCHVPSGLTLSRWEKALEGFARRKEEEGW
jgi:hypothetical protein